ncbi:MerR family transcriptional regulator [Spiroplasma clarkii]|uniref:MerR family transcriptional regulator n=1 Tax=Spiroplasma clarkii TaxID=2139 RepID=UPI000B57F920|nr:MerR family transcriptional regulator [Spiroplasma clarkii]ARU90981.1 MerR family transcriptional regulator [Spiroplasma clarkii]
MKKFYLKDIAQKFEMKEYNLRFYDEKGLIKDFKRDENGYRYLLEDDLHVIDLIICLKQIGMPLKNIKKYMRLLDLGEKSAKERLNLILQQEKVVLKNQESIQKQIEFIEHKKRYYSKILENKKITLI